MSRTDATRPYWVQLRDPDFPWGITEYHHHWGSRWRESQECDLGYPVPVTRRVGFRACELWPKYRDNHKIYGRTRYRRSFKSFQDGRARADLRRLKAKWIREPIRGDIDSNENLPTSRWRWRRWYWD